MRNLKNKTTIFVLLILFYGCVAWGMNNRKTFRFSDKDSTLSKLFVDREPTEDCLEYLNNYKEDLLQGKITDYAGELKGFDEIWRLLNLGSAKSDETLDESEIFLGWLNWHLGIDSTVAETISEIATFQNIWSEVDNDIKITLKDILKSLSDSPQSGQFQYVPAITYRDF